MSETMNPELVRQPTMEHPMAPYLRMDRIPHVWCPGCGIGTVVQCYATALEKAGCDLDKVSVVSGIGCSGRAAGYMKLDGFHATHGRAIPFATGLKLGRPELLVTVISGDGDLAGIGGNHFIHAARRNIDLLVILINNFIYGMTGGQVAPTTPMHATTQTSPHGNPEQPIDACAVAISCGASYVGRWTTAHPNQTRKAIKQAINHKGFSFLHVLSQCPTQAGRYIYDTGKPEEMLQQLKKSAVTIQKAAKMSEEDLEDRTVVGLLHETKDRPELCESIYALMQNRKG